MTSKIKVDNINKVSDDSNIINKCGTNITMGQNGDTVILPNGVTEQVQSGGAIQVQSGGSITIASGATITNNGTAVGLGRTGTVDWATTPVTATFTAANGVGYFANTSGGAFTINLPAGVAGAIVSVADYAETWQTNNLTVSPNGTDKIGGLNVTAVLDTQGQSVTFVFVDSTQGWINTMDSTSNVRGSVPFMTVSCSGGSVTTVGNNKIHTFCGPGSFTVCQVSTTPANNKIAYMVVGGGGGGGTVVGGGAGAGGFREGKCNTITPYTASPLVTTAFTATAATFPITKGAGGAAGGSGSNSVFGSIVSQGGGNGGNNGNGGSGGSGGGASNKGTTVGSGNTPPVSPPQGNPGGAVPTAVEGAGSGGGGAGGAGANATGGQPAPGAQGGSGVNSTISNSDTNYAGGGGGGGRCNSGAPGGSPTAGAGAAYNGPAGGNGSAGSGSGAGGSGYPGPGGGGTGGSGMVIVRYKFQ